MLSLEKELPKYCAVWFSDAVCAAAQMPDLSDALLQWLSEAALQPLGQTIRRLLVQRGRLGC